MKARLPLMLRILAITMYGRIMAGQYVKPGSYSDIVSLILYH